MEEEKYLSMQHSEVWSNPLTPHQTPHLACVLSVHNNIVIVTDPNFERVDEGEFTVDTPQQHHKPVPVWHGNCWSLETSKYLDIWLSDLKGFLLTSIVQYTGHIGEEAQPASSATLQRKNKHMTKYDGFAWKMVFQDYENF